MPIITSGLSTIRLSPRGNVSARGTSTFKRSFLKTLMEKTRTERTVNSGLQTIATISSRFVYSAEGLVRRPFTPALTGTASLWTSVTPWQEGARIQ